MKKELERILIVMLLITGLLAVLTTASSGSAVVGVETTGMLRGGTCTSHCTDVTSICNQDCSPLKNGELCMKPADCTGTFRGTYETCWNCGGDTGTDCTVTGTANCGGSGECNCATTCGYNYAGPACTVYGGC